MTASSSKTLLDPDRGVSALPRENHHNQFGIVRLVLAVLVILSHSVPLAQGFLAIEPLERVTGTTSFGDLSVDFFFVISGYLVTQSLERSRSVLSYLNKRIRRIYPGFLVAVTFSVLLALLCDGRLIGGWTHLLLSMLTLGQPLDVAAFPGNAYDIPNGSLWTIRYELACYFLPVLALCARVNARPNLLIALSLVLIFISVAVGPAGSSEIAKLHNPSRLAGIFVAGMYFSSANYTFNPKSASIAAALACVMLFTQYTAALGIAFAGGYALLFICLYHGSHPISAVGRRTDVSYGVYLYAWPIQSWLVWIIPEISWVGVFLVATPLAIAAGWLSWTFVEAPLLKWRIGKNIQV